LVHGNLALVHDNLGIALHDKGQLDEAIAEHREALRLDKDLPGAHTNLGSALHDKGRLDEAIAAYHKAIELDPKDAMAHHNLGNALHDKGQLDEAIAEFRQSLRMNKDDAVAHNNLGNALQDKGRLEEAIAEFREAIRLKKDYALAHYNLGSALSDKGQLDEAIAAYKEATRLKPDYPEAHCNLGHVLRDKGQFAEALTHLRRGHELGAKNPRWPYPSAQWVKECERLVELDSKLPAILSGKEQPADAGQRAEYAQLCHRKRLYAAAARLYREAIAAKPDQVVSPVNRYNAACAAVLAGCGAGEDAAKLPDAERAGLRQQALDWLRADLDAWRRLLDKEPDKARPGMAQQMRHWLRDPDFNGVRGPDALAKLPPAERAGWRKLWADVAALLRQATPPP
jgi:tetratricopeptide (TPR) repeat protein